MEENNLPTQPPIVTEPKPTRPWLKIAPLAVLGVVLAGGLVFVGIQIYKISNVKSQIAKLNLKSQVPTSTVVPLLTPTSTRFAAEEIASLLCARTGDPGAHIEDWSSDKKYVACESGTAAAVRSLRVVGPEDNSITDSFAYKRDAYGWSPSGHYLAFSRPEEVDLSRHPIESLNEGSGSLSLVLYDAAQRNFKVLFQGNSDNGYLFVYWEGQDKLMYKQFDPQNPDLYILGGTPSRCFIYDLAKRENHSVKCD